MQQLFNSYVKETASPIENQLLAEFQEKEKDKIYRIQNNSRNKEQVEKYLFQQILVFFSKKSKTELKDTEIELKYIDKN